MGLCQDWEDDYQEDEWEESCAPVKKSTSTDNDGPKPIKQSSDTSK